MMESKEVSLDQIFTSEIPRTLRLLRRNRSRWSFLQKSGKNHKLSFGETNSFVTNTI